MALEAQIVAVLKADAAVTAIVGDRIYAMPAPQGTTVPFITYQLIAVNRVGQTYTSGSSHDVQTLQIDCWSDPTGLSVSNSRYDKITQLARAVRSALDQKGLIGDNTVDMIAWDSWADLSTPEETRRSLDFRLSVRGSS